MTYDVVLFDLDGTLTESAPGIIHSAKIAAEKLGFAHVPDESFISFIGPPLHGSFLRIGMSEAQADQAMVYYREYFAEYGLFENSVYTGLPNLLRRLKAQGARLYVATAKPQVYADRILERFGLSRFFERVVGVDLNDRVGDKAKIIREALPADARRAVMIGDREFDILGGRDNGIETIGVCYGYGSREELAAAGATHIVETVAALGDLLAPEVPEPRGFFISVEGLDGSGKTTQLDLIGEHLRQRGYDVLRTREPGGSPIAEDIREVVLTPRHVGMHPLTEALLYAAARAEHVHAIVQPALAQGKTVLCDRFVDSSVAYQGGGRRLGVQHVLNINAPAVDGTMPDATVLLRIDAETAIRRRAAATSLDRIEMEEMAFHQRVFNAYEELAKLHPARIHPVDATRSVEEIAAAAGMAIDGLLTSR